MASTARPAEHATSLASAEHLVLDYLRKHPEIKNAQAREIMEITNGDRMKGVLYRLRDRGLIERIEGRRGNTSALARAQDGITGQR